MAESGQASSVRDRRKMRAKEVEKQAVAGVPKANGSFLVLIISREPSVYVEAVHASAI
jgi:hypothetical protein